MRTGRPSLTASLVAAARALYTEMPEPYRIAPDPLAARLVHGAFALPARAIAHARWAAPVVHHVLGVATLGLSDHVPLRTRAIDDALREACRLGATEVVVLGAGFDSRAMRIDELASARVYEVDHPSTQALKVARLAALHDAPSVKARSLTRVALDFERERLEDVLPRHGFDPALRSFWIWEGVALYLTRDAIEATLRAVAELSAPGSRLAMTYGVPPDAPAFALPLARRMLDAAGEPMRTALGPDELDELLQRAGFARIVDDSTPDWAARYWPSSARKVRAIERLAVAERVG